MELRRVDLANWVLQTSPKFTKGVKYQFHQGFWPDQRSRNPNHSSTPISSYWLVNQGINASLAFHAHHATAILNPTKSPFRIAGLSASCTNLLTISFWNKNSCYLKRLVYIYSSTPMVPWLSYLPLDPRFMGSNLAEVDGFFQSIKVLSMTSFGREVKPCVPCLRFTACKRTSSWN